MWVWLGIGAQLRLCFGTYGQVLKRCVRAGVTQVELGNKLLYSVNGTYAHYSDSQVSDLFNGRKNIGSSEAENAQFCDRPSLVERFANHVSPLLDSGKVPLAVAAVRAIARADEALNPRTVINPIDGLTKSDAAKQACFDPWGFLAGVLAFVVAEAVNRGAKDDCDAVGELFDEGLMMEVAAITLVDAYDKIESHSCRIWADGPSSLDVVEGDLFELASSEVGDFIKRIAVIPVDVDFTTQIATSLEELDEGGISPKSVHGKWLLGLMSGGMSKTEISERIVSVLERQGLDGSGVPVGTVSVVDLGATAYYLLAISRMDEGGNTRSSKGEIDLALSRLVDFYDRHGQGYPLYVPLVGTGLSRARLSVRASYEAIRGAFSAASDRVHGSVSIVVLPGSWDELGLDSEPSDERATR